MDMQQFEIGTAPPYHTLSYTWGAPDDADPDYDIGHRRPVNINNQSFYAHPPETMELIRKLGKAAVEETRRRLEHR
jgi:hypothetical protein